MISSQSRYDHFDTAPCIYLQHQPSKVPWKKERTDGENYTIFTCRWYPESPVKSRFFKREFPKWSFVFESFSLWPLRYVSVLYFQRFAVPRYKTIKRRNRRTKRRKAVDIQLAESVDIPKKWGISRDFRDGQSANHLDFESGTLWLLRYHFI